MMAIRPHHILLLAILPAAHQARADVCDVPMELPAKPTLSDYADYGAFVVDIMNFKKKEDEKRQHRQDCPDLYQEAPIVFNDGPEDLEQAVAEADDPLRAAQRAMASPPAGDRSTSRDFPLDEAGGDLLSGLFLNTSLDVLDPQAAVDPAELSRFLSLVNALVDDPSTDVTDPQRQEERYPEGTDFLLENQVPILGPLQIVDIEFGDRTSILLRADGSQLNRSATVMQNCLSSCAGN